MLPSRDGLRLTTGDDNVDVKTYHLSRERGEVIGFSVRMSPFDDNVLPLHVAKFAQTLLERIHAGRNC